MEKPPKDEKPKESSPKTFLSILKYFSVEPFVFIFMLASIARKSIYSQIFLDKVCVNTMHYNLTECTAFNQTLINEQQDYVTKYNMATQLIGAIPSAMMSFVLSNFGEKYGRKYQMLVTCSGLLLCNFLSIFCLLKWDSPSWYLLLATIPEGLGGGIIALVSGSFTHISTITDPKSRPTRFAVLGTFLLCGATAGGLLSGVLLKYLDYMMIFVVSFCLMVVAMIWILIMLEEPKKKYEENSFKSVMKGLFSMSNITRSVRTCIKKRPGNIRLEIWLLTCSSSLMMENIIGSSGIDYLYTRKKFNWELSFQLYVNGATSVIASVIGIIGVNTLSKRLNFSDAAIGIIGTVSLMSKQIITGCAEVEWLYFVGLVSGLLQHLGFTATRTRATKLVPPEETGHVLALYGMFETLTPIVGTLCFSMIYSASLDFFPGLPYLVGAGLLVISLAVLIWIKFAGPTDSQLPFRKQPTSESTMKLSTVSTKL